MLWKVQFWRWCWQLGGVGPQQTCPKTIRIAWFFYLCVFYQCVCNFDTHFYLFSSPNVKFLFLLTSNAHLLSIIKNLGSFNYGSYIKRSKNTKIWKPSIPHKIALSTVEIFYVSPKLHIFSTKIFNWCPYNYTKLNFNKCQKIPTIGMLYCCHQCWVSIKVMGMYQLGHAPKYGIPWLPVIGSQINGWYLA